MIFSSVLLLFGLGLIFAIILSIASVLFRVDEDPRIEAVAEILPGANCGGCGFAGCDAYAAAVVMDANVPPNQCVAGGDDVANNIGQLTGKAAGSSEVMISFRRCLKNEGNVSPKYKYQGIPTCTAAHKMGGIDNCKYACLGFGDCVKACPFDAMIIDNGVVRIDPALCKGCGICVRTCPQNILELIPEKARVMVYCSSLDKGKAVMDVCQVGCISCMACVKKCPADAIKMEKGRIKIDHTKCLDFGPECEEACIAACSKRHILKAKGHNIKQQQSAA